ncbi:MAG: FAD-dependent oxidoreductase [Kiritimatiellae bacterium]|nr:FAD-dependent oxidoreductase [Kiritimatiellia bacterium]
MRTSNGLLAGLLLTASLAAFAETVEESARKIPLLKDVDVVVVGGTFGGVKAAIAAKEAGASVFLVAPRPHLGEEVVTTRQLWGDPYAEGAGDPLVQAAFEMTPSTDFSYTYDATPDAMHPDNNFTVLTDGRYTVSSQDSVQFNTDTVTINVALSGNATVSQITLSTFLRAQDNGFATTSLSVSTSLDDQSYTDLPGTLHAEEMPCEGGTDLIRVFHFTPDFYTSARYLKIRCSKAYSRQLLGELVIGTQNASTHQTRPLKVEKTLDAALTDAEVPYLTGSFVTGTLTDKAGAIAGVVIANRNGRQAIRAKTVIDASEWASVARAHSPTLFQPLDLEGGCTFTRVVTCMTNGLPVLSRRYTVEERKPAQAQVSLSPDDLRVPDAPTAFGVTAYVISGTWSFTEWDYAAYAEIEKTFISETWTPTTVDASEKLFFTPPSQIDSGKGFTGDWPGAAALSLSVFQPQALPYLYVLGPCADLPRTIAGYLQQPGVACLLGARIGAAAATDALSRPALEAVGTGVTVSDSGKAIRERLTVPLNVGLDGSETIFSSGANLPVLGKVDVVVAGAGTAGAPAAIAAAREGRNVLALEYLYTMGGTAIDTRIGRYYRGFKRGFTSEIDEGWPSVGIVFYTAKPEWYRETLVRSGGNCWFGAFVEGAYVPEIRGGGYERVNGVIVVLPDGTRGIIKAAVVIDSTGNADVAAAAGLPTDYLHAHDFALQGASVCAQKLGSSYLNFDIGFMNDTDAGDLSAFGRRARMGMSDTVYNSGASMTGTRERRRIVGDVQITEVDVIRGRTWSDTIMHGTSCFDSHGYTTSDLMMFFTHSSSVDFAADVPYRALLPAGIEGVIATGLGISATRDAMPIIRMQPDVQNQGYAAGLAAAAAVAGNTGLRGIDIKALQQKLVAKGALEERVLTDTDAPVPQETIAAAVNGLTTTFKGLEIILADTDTALPLLQSAFAGATDDNHKNALACVLALLGDRAGIDDLIVRLNSSEWDTGMNFMGMGQYGRSTSLMDAMVYALGKSADSRIIPVLTVLCNKLRDGDQHQLSHYRMMTLSSDGIYAPSLATAAKTLLESQEELLTGQSTNAIIPVTYNTTLDNAERTDAIRSLNIAKLLYRQNDSDGIGERLLTEFAGDARASYAAYARLVLEEGPLAANGSSDGIWIGTALSDTWGNASGWENGVIASGETSKATIAAASPTETLSLGGNAVTIGELEVQGSVPRHLTDGALTFGGMDALLTIAQDGTLTVDADLGAYSLQKQGEGTLAVTGNLHVDDTLKVEAGTVAFNAEIPVFQPYTVGTVTELDPNTEKRGYGYTFTVTQGPLWVTHLGCFDSTGEGFQCPIRTYLADDETQKVIAEVSFDVHISGFLRNGYRFIRLPKACKVETGKSYTIRSFGFMGNQSCPIAADGEAIAPPDSAEGRLAFGTVLKTGTGLNLFEDVVEGKSGYGAAAASLLLLPVDPEQVVGGTIQIDSAITLGSPILSVGNLTGSGSVTVGRNDTPVLLKVGGSEDALFNGNIVESDGLGKLALQKAGTGTLRLEGNQSISEMVYCQNGILDLASPDMLDSATPLAFGDPKAKSMGRLTIDGDTISLTNPIYASKQYRNNVYDAGLVAKPGQALTLHDTRVYAYNSIENSSDYPSSFTLRTTPCETTPTTITASNLRSEYVDFFAAVPGSPDFASQDVILLKNLESKDQLRKLVAMNDTPKTQGGTIFVTGTNTVRIGWMDISGYGSSVILSNVTVVADNVRFANINNGDYVIPEANGILSVVDGARLVVPQLPSTTYNTTNSAIRFDNAIVQLKGGDQGNFLNFPANQPIEVLEGGVVFDLMSYDAGAPRSLRIRHPLTSPVEGVPGPLTIRNGGDFKVSSRMAHNGPTIVEGGLLLFDFTVGDGQTLDTMLKSGTDLILAGGRIELMADHEGQYQSFRSIANTSGAEAEVKVGADGEIRTAQLHAGELAKTGAGTLTLNLSATDGTEGLDGTVHVREGTFRIRSLSERNGPYEMPDGSFEPTPALSGGVADLDRRGQRNKAYFDANLTAWHFDNNNNVGICKRGSYFMNNDNSGTPWGTHCAFLRNGDGSISQTFSVADDGLDYILSFGFKSRYYGGDTYPAPIMVYLDEQLIYASETKFLTYTWEEVEIDLGILTAGNHTVRFTSGTDKAGSSKSIDVLLDNVCLTTVETANLDSHAVEHLTLDVSDGATLALEFDAKLPVEAFYVNGVRQYGLFSAETRPDLITGSGSLCCFENGTVFILK